MIDLENWPEQDNSNEEGLLEFIHIRSFLRKTNAGPLWDVTRLDLCELFVDKVSSSKPFSH